MPGAARKTAQVARDRAVEHHVSRATLLLPPWIGVFLIVPVAAVLHKAWPHWWAALAAAAAAVVLGVMAVCFTHDKTRAHRAHLAVTCAAAGGFTAAAIEAGFASGVWFAWVFGIWTCALSWNIRHGARHQALGDLLGHLLGAAHEAAGLEGATVTLSPAAPGAKVIKGRVRGVPGAHTAKTFADQARFVESGAGLPPGALAYSPAGDNAADAQVSLSDPRSVAGKPVPWAGPSAPGASVAKPIRPGLWQTGEAVLMSLVPVHHLIIAGMTGAAKSTGWGWSMLAELVTRADARIYGLDPVKGEQTLGPFRGCLARDAPGCSTGILTDPGACGPFLAWVRAQIRPRTDYLAAQGLQAWREGCGIPLLIVWMEEAPDVLDYAGGDAAEEWVKSLKAARSAGIMFIYSCQRPDWTQMPTIARAQIAGRVACGVNTDGDADLCITERQDRANVEPQQWADRKPGMAYLDGPWVADELLPVGARAFYWGEDNTAITQHCAAFARTTEGAPAMPTGPHPVPGTDGAGWPPGREDDTPATVAAQVLGADPDPGLAEADVTVVPDVPDGVWGGDEEPAGEVPEQTARQALDDWLAERLAGGNPTFRASDLTGLRAYADRSRSWGYDELARRVALGQLTRHPEHGTWTVVRAA